MKLERNSRESKALDLMRFPLATLIVLLHTEVACGTDNFTYYLAHYVNGPIVRLAVPAFFFMSGYLFFIGKEEFGFTEYVNMLKKKAKSLLMPYLIWNLIAFGLLGMYEYLKDGSIDDLRSWSLMDVFWAHGQGIQATSVLGYQYPVIVSPAAGVLWFMRDLMMMMVCSIFAYPIVKCLRWWLFPLFLLMNILGVGIPFAGFSLSAITFFYSGAFFSIHQVNIFKWLEKKRVLWLLLWPSLVILFTTLNGLNISILSNFSVIVSMAGVVFVFLIAYTAVKRESKIVKRIISLGETSFFIYTFGNTMILWLVNKDIGYLLESIPLVGCFLSYEFLFVAKIVECIAVFYLLKRYAPRLLNVLIGNRIKR